MTDTSPRTTTEAQAARAGRCPLCQAAPGAPCQRKPPGDTPFYRGRGRRFRRALRAAAFPQLRCICA
jgi:hypothetical protein